MSCGYDIDPLLISTLPIASTGLIWSLSSNYIFWLSFRRQWFDLGFRIIAFVYKIFTCHARAYLQILIQCLITILIAMYQQFSYYNRVGQSLLHTDPSSHTCQLRIAATLFLDAKSSQNPHNFPKILVR